jgi:hypothetical protein
VEAIAHSTIRRVPRQARGRHEGRIVAKRRFDTLRMIGEEVAGFESRPVACKNAYQLVVPREELVVGQGNADRPTPTPLGVVEDQYHRLVTLNRVEAGVVPRRVGERLLHPSGLALAGRLPGPRGPMPLDARGRRRPRPRSAPEGAERRRQKELLAKSPADFGMSVLTGNIPGEDGVDLVGDLVILTRAPLVGDGTREGVRNFGEEAFEKACQVVAALGVYPRAWGLKPPKGAGRGKKG